MRPLQAQTLGEPHGQVVEGAERAGAHTVGRRDDALAVVDLVELQTGRLQGHSRATPAQHLERQRRPGHVLLDDGLVPGRAQRADGGGDLLLAPDHADALAAAGRVRLDHSRQTAGRPGARKRHPKVGEQPPGGALGLGHPVRVQIEEERHVPRRHTRRQPLERVEVLAGRQHGVTGPHEGAGERLVGGDVGDHVAVGKARRRRSRAAVDEDGLEAGEGGKVARLRALQFAADDQQLHAGLAARRTSSQSA